MRLFIVFLMFFLTGCENDALAPIKAKLQSDRDFTVLTRVGSSTDEATGASGFDLEIVQRFMSEQGIRHRVVTAASDADLQRRLASGDADMAAAWQSPSARAEIRSSVPYAKCRSVLVTHEASLPVTSTDELAGKTVHVVAGSRQEAALLELGRSLPGLTVLPMKKLSELDLMEYVAKRRMEAVLVSSSEFDIGSNYYPELQSSLTIGDEQPIVWLFGSRVGPEVIAKADAFIGRWQENGEMDRLKDRYFGHVARLTPLHSVRFIESITTVLPTYRRHFETAEAETGIDWQLLAALAYQESQWNPLASSRTGVRGMMMLTEETADEHSVGNRLDAAQSIRAGAEYLNRLRNALPPEVREPDRMWLALAAYNLGMGHLRAARHIARTLNADADSWYEMKKVLPLLAKEQYYKRLKSGRGRGGEAVIMVENIRMFVDILNRHERSAPALPATAQMTTGGLSHPLQTSLPQGFPVLTR